MMRVIRLLALALALALGLAPTIAAAQTAKETPKPPAAAPAPVPATPERTTASFGDWVMRCDATPPPVKRVCEVAQLMTVQGQAAPVAQVAFGRTARGEPMRATLVLPVAVLLTTKPKILSEREDKSPLEVSWQRCVPGGCIASVTVGDDVMVRLGARTEPGSIVFKDAAEHDIAFPLSFRGLAQALAALAKES
jgi:invasion protein IalB